MSKFSLEVTKQRTYLSQLKICIWQIVFSALMSQLARASGHLKTSVARRDDYIELPSELRMEGKEADLAIDVV